MIRIVMDSGGDLPPDLLDAHDICVVPINIHFGTQVFREGVDIDHATFYRKVDASKMIPQTAQPSPHQFAEAYWQAAREAGATDIISVNLTSQLSGTHASSLLAAQEVAGEVRVHPFDTRSGSAGQGMMGLAAARMAAAGASVESILAQLRRMRESMNIFLALENLRYAQMSGRVGTLSATLSALLKIKPVLTVHDGSLQLAERVRTRTRAWERMIENVKERLAGRLANVAVVHAQAPDAAQQLLARVRSEFHIRESFLTQLSVGIAVHLGPGTVGLVAYPVE